MLSPVRLLLFPTLAAAAIAAAGAVFAQEDVSPGQAVTVDPAGISFQPDMPQPVKRVRTATSKLLAPRAMAVAQAAAVPVLPSQPAAAQLPNGASSITESYGDWNVNCHIDNGQKLCTLSQAQGNKQTGQRSFAIELMTPKGGKTDGTILMPFGLNLEAGALLKLDDKDLGKGLRFSTCVPDGCLLPVSFPAVATNAMQTAKTLTVASLNLNSDQAVTFAVSLKGFPAALKRVADLGN